MKLPHISKKIVTFVVFFLPFIQVFLPIYVHTRLVSSAPAGQQFNQAAWRDLHVVAIKDGMKGKWAIDMPYSTTPDAPVFGYYFFFITLGHINKLLFHMDPVTLLNLTQFVMGPVFFVATFLFLRLLLPYPVALLAYIFVLTLETGFFLPKMFTHPFSAWEPSFDWQQQLVHRHFGSAHHTFGKMLGILFGLSYYKLLLNGSRKWILFLIPAGFFGSLILPPLFLVFILCIILPMGLYFFWKKKFTYFLSVSIPAVLVILLPTIFLRYQFTKVPAFNNYSSTEKGWWNSTDIFVRYVSSLLLYVPFFIFSLIFAITTFKKWTRQLKATYILSWLWIIIPGALIPISSQAWFPVANARLVDGYQYLPAGIISAIGLWQILQKCSVRIRTIAAVFILTLTLAISASTTNLHIASFLKLRSIPYTNFYPFEETWMAFAFMGKFPQGSGVLSLSYVGEILPTYTNVHVFSAVPDRTWPNFEKRDQAARWFYSGTLTDAQVRLFMKENNIDFVYYGPDEKLLTQTPLFYPQSLFPIYKNAKVIIYKERK